MTMTPLTHEDLNRLERANYRRTTLLTSLTLVWIYALSDALLRLGPVNRIEVVRLIDTAIPDHGFGQLLVFVIAAILIWILFYLSDDRFEQAGQRSLFYRLAHLEHSRPFNTVFLCALVGLAGLASQYRLDDPSFWLIWTMLLLSCTINYVEPGARRARGVAWYGMRLRLLLHRVPFFGRRMVRLDPITQQMAQESTDPPVVADDARAGAGPAPPDARASDADADVSGSKHGA